MSQDFYSGSLASEGKPPRVEILRGTGGRTPYFRKGQFGYVVGVNTVGGVYFADKEGASAESQPGEVAFLVSKTADMRGGALYLSAEALRFTKAPTDPLKALTDEERVALDLFLANGSANKTAIAELIPDASRRGYLKMLAAQLKSLRARER